MATFQYHQNGVNIDFPQNIFDVNADFNALALASANPPTNPGAPSCAAGESAMRENAWLDAVMAGCSDSAMSNAILVMCQEGANFAPRSGACNATGTW
jgi:hypothetical protein